MNKDLCYKIGYVAKTHGLKGEVTLVITEAVDLESIESLFLEIKNNLVPYFIEHLSDRQDKVFIKFEEVNTAEQAALLKGASIYLDKSLRPKLARGEFYDDEIIGFTAEDSSGMLGTVTGVIQSGASRLIQIDNNGKEVLIPVNGPFITSINKSKKKIALDLPEGFLEI
ncbi:MAG: 16S rRNA processing protein RimM [Cyclobacteriaceae bacterium]|nr:MAG: 16S rRNA processing protein RimM [Cyclobacteriaceae bacterium]